MAMAQQVKALAVDLGIALVVDQRHADDLVPVARTW
jgi:hypothetical protein